MMQRIDRMANSKPGPKSTQRKEPVKPFRAIEFNGNPWALCREYQDCIPIVYGTINHIVATLVQNMSPGDKFLTLERRLYKRYPDGRAFQIRLRAKQGYILGGEVWLRDSHGRSITVRDVKSLFQLNWSPVRRLYGSNDLAGIMETTRSSLREVGITSYQQRWHLCSSLSAYLWKKLKIDLNKVPCVQTNRREPGNLQGYNVFGHTNEPVYFYDIHSAYLSEMAKFPVLKPFTDYIWSARQELTQANNPVSYLLKLTGTVIPGKFSSTLPNNSLYRPLLGRYIRQQVNARLRTAMRLSGECYRWCVDGFISNEDFGYRLDIGDKLGQWKPVQRQPDLVIAQTNVWWAGNTHKDGGYRINRQDVMNNPFEIPAIRTIFSWDLLEERQEPIVLHQNHYEDHCRACQGNGGTLHDRVPNGIILITEADMS